MIRTSMAFSVNALTVRNLNAYDHLISNGPQIQCVRWKRKPIWLPTAKSKLFRIPTRPVVPTEDQLELKRLHNNYRTLMKSVRRFFFEREQERQKSLEVNVVTANIQKDFEICSYINNTWNEQSATIRKQRLFTERDNRKKEIVKKVEQKKKRDTKILQKVDAKIKKAKEEAPTFITAENIDDAIRKSLENIVNHNAAIDVNGNLYEEKPEKVVSTTN